MSIFERFKPRKYAVAGAFVLAIAIMMSIIVTTGPSYASEELYNITIGGKTVAVVSTERNAKAVIRRVQNYYISENDVVTAVSVDPEMAVSKKAYKNSKLPDVMSVREAVTYIVTGTKKPVTYTIQKGDSLWKIAEDSGFTMDEIQQMNADVDFTKIQPGDTIRLNKTEPFVNVTVTKTVTDTEQIKFRTVTRKSDSLLINTSKVKQEGSYGEKQVTADVTTVNGVETARNVTDSVVTKKPVKRIIIKGTATQAAAGTDTLSGSGQAIASYALQFVGNPYVYGGSSLTSGCDCSGFVMAVFANFGITMAHDAGAMEGYGREVSYAEAQPGDLICYGWHVAIYIGNGQVVHAVNEGMGIAVTSATYVGPIACVRRIVE